MLNRILEELYNVKKTCVVFTIIILLVSSVPFSNASNILEYRKNQNGETIGNDIQAKTIGYSADLILAIGEDDVMGYVRKTDLEGNVSSPSETIKIENSKKANYIPIYKEDGITVVGTFLLENNYSLYATESTSSDYFCGKIGAIYVGNNYNCSTVSGIRTAIGGVRGMTRITASKVLPEGWLGVQARIYKSSNGALVRSTNFYYNEERAKGFEQTGYHATALYSTTYYSKGYVKTWNPSVEDYWTTDTFPSPAIYP